MKTKFIIFSLVQIIVSFTLLNSIMWNVNLDGTGDFTEIQAGIDAAEYGDTILVHPGRYIENISLDGRWITVASLYLVTEERSYIYNTIIDGNQNGSVVLFDESWESNEAVLCGFTITNGSGNSLSGYFNKTYGGGIYIDEASPTLKNLIIEYNEASSGGGIYCNASNAYLEDLTLRHNHAFEWGGGICISYVISEIIFSSDNRCNIYGNYAADSNDIYLAESYNELLEIFIDTLSVQDYDNHFVTDHPYLMVDVLNGKYEQVNCDLFVNPDGSDENNGCTENDPLQTIQWALAKIESDSLDPKTIFLSTGIYSHNANNQFFSLNGKSHVKIIGAGKEETILDGENLSGTIMFRDDYDCILSGFSVINNYTSSACIPAMRSDLNLSDIKISNSILLYGGIMLSGGSIIGDNIEILNNQGNQALRVGKYFDTDASCTFTNLTITNNYPYYDEDGSGGAIIVNNCTEAIFVNTLVANNTNYDDTWPLSNFLISGTTNAYLLNSTVCNNHSNYGAGMGFRGPGNLYIINSIIYDNSPYEFILQRSDQPGYIHFDYTNIDEQNDFIVVAGPDPCVPEIIWGEGYIRQDPQFIVGDEADPLYYQLSDESPCIDAGTGIYPTGIELREFDLLGNPRIYGDCIDMGAYEWQGVETVDEIIDTDLWLCNYPNPFNPSTTIKFDMRKAGFVNLKIYNIKGQKVISLINQQQEAGYHSKVWDGSDDAGNSVGSGIYFYRLIVDGTAYPMRKCLLLK